MKDVVASRVTDAELSGLFAPIARFEFVALAVSGGSDSLGLLHLFARWRMLTAPNLPALVLTVDHRLRADSVSEADFVAREADAVGLHQETLIWEGFKPATGVAQAAREARYRLMGERLSRDPYSRVALLTAHTQDDQAETVLMRLARGSGVEGLRGMKRERPLDTNRVTLVRPVLSVPKERLKATLAALGKTWMTDPTNADVRYERPRLRATAALREAVGVTNAALSLTAKRLARADEALQVATDELARTCVIAVPGLSITLDRAMFSVAPLDLRVRLIDRCLRYAGGSHPVARLSEIERLVDRLVVGDCAVTLGGCRIAPTPERITVIREPGRTGLCVVALRPGQSAVWDNRFTVSLAPAASEGCTVRALTGQEWALLRELPGATKISAAIALTIPSFWIRGSCVDVPSLRQTLVNRHKLCSDTKGSQALGSEDWADGLRKVCDDEFSQKRSPEPFCDAVPRDGHDLTSSCFQSS